MKVLINHTLHIEDDDLRKMADVIDGKETRRTAKRDEVKGYVWSHGADWATALAEDHGALFGAPEDSPGVDVPEDLIGDASEAPEPDSEDDDFEGLI